MRIRFCVAVLLATMPPGGAAAAVASAPTPTTTVDRFARYVKAAVWVEGAEGKEFVELLVDGEEAALRTRVTGASTPKFFNLTRPDDVLMLLADRRLEALWAPLTDWSGPSLELMRARMIRRFRSAALTARPDMPAGSTSESTVRPQVRAILQYASILDLTGHGAEAEDMLREHLAGMRPKLGGGWRGVEWQSVASAIAWSRKQRDDPKGAIAEYEAIERALGSSPFAVNATVNRAAALAMDGQYAPALATIEQAWARYLKDNRGDKVPGSERQFSWIRACALQGLGREAEARAAMPRLSDDREFSDEDFVVEPDNDLKIRNAMCMRDGSEVARLIARDFRRVGRSPALILLQPAYVPRGDSRAIIDAVRADSALAAAARERMRTLPSEMSAALNGWKGMR